MKKKFKQVLLIIGAILIGSTFVFWTSTGTNTTSIDVKNHTYLPDNINFAGEKVPMHIVDVRERMDREMIVNVNLHGSTILSIKRAKRYFPIIEPILKRNGIPDDFKYLAVIESTLSNATSPAGARGFWQFMSGTAKDFNLEVTDYVDERYDLEKATQAACDYFIKAKNRFGSWTLAAAAYNRGVAGVSRQLEAQMVDNYYDLFIAEETSRYVFRILALKEIMTNPIKYGFELPNSSLYHPIRTKKVPISDDIEDLAVFAKEQGINYKILKLHNPWLRNTALKGTEGKTYYIDIPTEGY